jgi:hypothetical protein
MKKILLLLVLSIFSFSVNAQIADGSVAPNFIATDINGNSHDLQTYLNQGKTVILNISATWCGPCWNYKQTGALQDIYYAYGEHGSDEVVILYVEGDASTGMDQLNGIGSGTVGDWVSSTPFPIIDDASIANAYQISYFPTVYRICPDGFVYEMGQLPSNDIINNINANCSGSLQGVANHVMAEVDDVKLCDDGLSADMTFSVKNYGNNTVTSVDYDLTTGANTFSYSATGNAPLFGEFSVTENVALSEGTANSVDFTSVNNSNVFQSVTNSSDFEVELAGQVNQQSVEVHIYTDFYPSEISWDLEDDNGNVIASGGPYQAGNEDQWGGGGPDAQTAKIHNVTLPDVDACYTVNLYDAFGDGWGFGSASLDPGVEIFENGNSVYLRNVGDFGSELNLTSAMKYNETFSVNTFEDYNFSMYPNPSNGVVNFTANESFSVEMFDINGRKVLQQDINLTDELNLSHLTSGVYLVKVNIDGINKTEKLILK